jgi:hypothetical protein
VGCFQRVGRTVSPRRSPLLRLFLLVALALRAKAQSTPWSYENYFNSSTTPLAQSQTAAAAVLNGLTLHVAVLNIVQNLTFFPDNITYGDGAPHKVGSPTGPLSCGSYSSPTADRECLFN